jgi:hypothetical protein
MEIPNTYLKSSVILHHPESSEVVKIFNFFDSVDFQPNWFQIEVLFQILDLLKAYNINFQFL